MLRIIKLIGRIAPYYLAISIPIFLILLLSNLLFLRPIDRDSKERISFEITEESKKDVIANILKNQGLARSSYALSFMIKRTESQKEKELVLTPGEYELSPTLSPKQLAESLWDLQKISRTFAIKAGDSYIDVAKNIDSSGLFKTEEVLSAMSQRALLIKLRLSAGIPEGYFLPGSYTFTKPIKAEEVIESLIKSSQAEINKMIPTFESRVRDLKLDRYQVLTLASLLEKEGLGEDEKKNFASLLLNRLTLEMPLESLPSLNYGINVLRSTNNPLTDADKANPNPYNTFIRPRLPATPICTPTIASIRAVLYPSDSTYIYFKRDSKEGLTYYSNKINLQQDIPG